jgi:hypothetical protein
MFKARSERLLPQVTYDGTLQGFEEATRRRGASSTYPIAERRKGPCYVPSYVPGRSTAS